VGSACSEISIYNRQGRYQGIRASIQDITKLKKAFGQIHELASVIELENKSKLRIKSKLEFKERELLSYVMQLSQQNELIAYVNNQLKNIVSQSTGNSNEKINQILLAISKVEIDPVDWEVLNFQVDTLHPGFINQISARHPLLTQNEKKLCVCLRLGLSSKEIAGLQNHSSKSVEIARVRLRKKLKLLRTVNLLFYLESLQ